MPLEPNYLGRRVAVLRMAAALALAPVLAGCAAPRPAAAPPPNVILVLADTLRADRLGTFGYPRDTSPNLDLLARTGVLFSRARSQAACTYPSINSLLTSIYPARFLLQPGSKMGIPEEIPTLAEILAGHGYQTAAVSASPIVRANPGRHNPEGGFGRGFQTFDDSCEWRPAKCVNERAYDLLETLGEPFFLYLHYMDPHDPYSPPDGFGRPFSTDFEASGPIARGDPNPIAEMLYAAGPPLEITREVRRHLSDLYDDEIAYLDQELGRLLEELDGHDLRQRSILVVASDHGEELLEHQHVKHCRTVFEASTHTPLLINVPDAPPAVVETAVQNLDLVPTLLDLLAIEVSGLNLQGTSLRPLMTANDSEERFAFSLQYPYASVDDGRFKLIADIAAGQHQLFDLAADPAETHDVWQQNPADAYRLGRILGPWLRDQVVAVEGRADPRLVAGSLEKLRALGYLR